MKKGLIARESRNTIVRRWGDEVGDLKRRIDKMKAALEKFVSECKRCNGTGREDDCGKTVPCTVCGWARKELE